MLVIVDLDDTLCNTWEAGRKTIMKSIPILLRRRMLRAVWYVLTARYRRLESRRDVHTLDLDGIVETVLRSLYPGIEEERLREITHFVEETFFSHLSLYPDALPFLKGLREMGARVVLITDSSTNWQRKKLRVLGIGDYFDDVIISGETGHSKFEDYNFRLALERFPDDEIYVVGDREETDMRGGRRIGARTILIKRGYHAGRRAGNADHVVGNLLEALEVIRNEHKIRA
ncbi:HAD family hydrolase [Thermococcus sp.]|uniref:HAD family hydrolase n=1 Tax=Thermococcus sp. TaxID=35749 RepID=UPI00262AAA19|nr:HAD family hydrolase [Thermococcus sp.]